MNEREKKDLPTDFENRLKQLRPVSGTYRFEPASGVVLRPKRSVRGVKIALSAAVPVAIAASLLLVVVFWNSDKPEPTASVPTPILTPDSTANPETPAQPRFPSTRRQVAILLGEMGLDSSAEVQSEPICRCDYPSLEISVSNKVADVPRKNRQSDWRCLKFPEFCAGI